MSSGSTDIRLLQTSCSLLEKLVVLACIVRQLQVCDESTYALVAYLHATRTHNKFTPFRDSLSVLLVFVLLCALDASGD